MNWSAPTDLDSVCKRAAGRRRYNAKRQAEARIRNKQVRDVIWSPDGRKRGTQAELARALGVHRSTICRDVAKWRRLWLEAMDGYRSLMAERENIADGDKAMDILPAKLPSVPKHS